jgi:two-component sensor histidine kinase
MIEDNGVGRTDDPARAGLGATVIGSAVQNLGAKLLEESCRADGERRGLRTTISRPHSRLA